MNGILVRRFLQAAAVAIGFIGIPNAVTAHPHVFVETSAQLVFDGKGKLLAIVNTWTFDEFYSNFVTLGLNAPGHAATEAQLRPIAETNITQMKAFNWFNSAKINGSDLKFAMPVDYQLTETAERRLVFQFTLPVLASPQIADRLDLQIFDPTYYVAFEADKANPARLSAEPASCTLSVGRPAPLTAEETVKVQAAKKFDTVFASDFSARLTSQIAVSCDTAPKN